MLKEEWRDVVGYEGLYKVSNLGEVKSLDKTVNSTNGSTQLRKGKLLSKTFIGIGKRKYYKITTHKNLKRKTQPVHKLVAMAFLDHKPNGVKIVIDHIDNNPLNNRLDNLQLISHRKNISKDQKGNSSKYVGVYYRKSRNKYESSILIDGYRKFLGSFKCELKAHYMYQQQLKKLNKSL